MNKTVKIIVVFIAIMLATFGLCYILDNVINGDITFISTLVIACLVLLVIIIKLIIKIINFLF